MARNQDLPSSVNEWVGECGSRYTGQVHDVRILTFPDGVCHSFMEIKMYRYKTMDRIN